MSKGHINTILAIHIGFRFVRDARSPRKEIFPILIY